MWRNDFQQVELDSGYHELLSIYFEKFKGMGERIANSTQN